MEELPRNSSSNGDSRRLLSQCTASLHRMPMVLLLLRTRMDSLKVRLEGTANLLLLQEGISRLSSTGSRNTNPLISLSIKLHMARQLRINTEDHLHQAQVIQPRMVATRGRHLLLQLPTATRLLLLLSNQHTAHQRRRRRRSPAKQACTWALDWL